MTDDKFFIAIEVSDPKYDVEECRAFLEKTGKLGANLAYTPAPVSGHAEGEVQGLGAKLVTMLPVGLSEKMAAKSAELTAGQVRLVFANGIEVSVSDRLVQRQAPHDEQTGAAGDERALVIELLRTRPDLTPLAPLEDPHGADGLAAHFAEELDLKSRRQDEEIQNRGGRREEGRVVETLEVE